MAKITFLYSHDDELIYEDHLKGMGHDVKCVRQCEEMPVNVPLDEFDCLVLSPTAKYNPPEPSFNFLPFDHMYRVDMPKQKQETAEERKNKLVMAEIDRAVKAYGASTVKLKSYKTDH